MNMTTTAIDGFIRQLIHQHVHEALDDSVDGENLATPSQRSSYSPSTVCSVCSSESSSPMIAKAASAGPLLLCDMISTVNNDEGADAFHCQGTEEVAPLLFLSSSHFDALNMWAAHFVDAFLEPVKFNHTKQPTAQLDAKEKVREVVHSIATRLYSGLICPREHFVLASILLQRAKESGTFTIQPSNARRAVIAALHLAAKAHSDEYFTLQTMCSSAGLPSTPEFVTMTATCEWKLFVSVEMNCLPLVVHFNEMCVQIMSTRACE